METLEAEPATGARDWAALATVAGLGAVELLLVYLVLTRVYEFGHALAPAARAAVEAASDEQRARCAPLLKSAERTALTRYIGFSMLAGASALPSLAVAVLADRHVQCTFTEAGRQYAVIAGMGMRKATSDMYARHPWFVLASAWLIKALVASIVYVVLYVVVGRLVGYGDPLSDEERALAAQAGEALKQECRPLQEHSNRRAVQTYFGVQAAALAAFVVTAALVLRRRHAARQGQPSLNSPT